MAAWIDARPDRVEQERAPSRGDAAADLRGARGQVFAGVAVIFLRGEVTFPRILVVRILQICQAIYTLSAMRKNRFNYEEPRAAVTEATNDASPVSGRSPLARISIFSFSLATGAGRV